MWGWGWLTGQAADDGESVRSVSAGWVEAALFNKRWPIDDIGFLLDMSQLNMLVQQEIKLTSSNWAAQGMVIFLSSQKDNALHCLLKACWISQLLCSNEIEIKKLHFQLHKSKLHQRYTHMRIYQWGCDWEKFQWLDILWSRSCNSVQDPSLQGRSDLNYLTARWRQKDWHIVATAFLVSNKSCDCSSDCVCSVTKFTFWNLLWW